ncbi:MAG: hypothetical protein MK052_00150 [Alphaproteobacteria bacterium]|nr:hypothetical protein [Alphaproteobacteria bacterium]
MKIISQSGFGVALLAMLAACANPTIAPPVTAADAQKECAALEHDIAEAARLKTEARSEDKFQWKYIFVVNAATSAYRMNKAEAAAQKRLEDLNQIAASKGCLGNMDKDIEAGTPITPMPVTPAPAEPTPAPIK